MASRIHIVLADAEKERFRLQAEREGKSLSEWLRDAARDRLTASSARRRMDTREELQAFFQQCDLRERGRGREPDWEDHERVIRRSVQSGAGDA